MTWFILARALFIAALGFTAGLLAADQRLRPHRPVPSSASTSPSASCWPASSSCLEIRLRDAKVTGLLGALLGGVIGLVIAKTIEAALAWTDSNNNAVAFLRSMVLLVLPYIGTAIGARKGEWLEPARLIGLFRAAGPQRRYKVLDTSVIIDGRIADICETGFIDGALVIPQFV